MVRMQLARDASLARALQGALKPQRTAVLIAGQGHVQRRLGVPTWMPPDTKQKAALAQAGQAQTAIENEAYYLHLTPASAAPHYCAGLRGRWPTSSPR